MAEAALLACDWGTTRLRAWTLGPRAEVLAEHTFDLGVSRLERGQAETVFDAQVRPALGAEGLPAMLCGMVGSDLGWRTVGYVQCPASLEDLAAGVMEVRDRTAPVAIAPGLTGPGLTGAPDVMRGEETQILGWLSLDDSRNRGRSLLCHPGTHSKWILVEDGRIIRFITFMTGELYAVLGAHSILKADHPAEDPTAFDEGAAAAGAGDALAARLFSARSRITALGKSPDSTASYLSGLLIGSEIAAAPALLGFETGAKVAVIGDPALCRWYLRALGGAGFDASVHDGGEAARAGLLALAHARAGS